MITQNTLLTFLVLAIIHFSHGVEFEKVFEWKKVEYDWPSPNHMTRAIQSGSYIPENNVPLALAIWKDKIFIAIPRWKSGVASTLNYAQIQKNKSPLLTPYPSWEANQISGIVTRDRKVEDGLPIGSVMQVWVDSCDRLWALDDGIDGIIAKQEKVVERSILIYDLNTNKLIKRHFFDNDSVTERPFLNNIVVDVSPNKCGDAFAYVADSGGYGLIVYDLKQDSSWLIRHLYLHPNPLAGEFIAEGVRVHWSDGILGMTLGNLRHDGYRTLYFHSLTSTTQFEVSTRTIQNKTWANSMPAFDDFKVTGERGMKTQSTTNCFDSNTGVIIYTQVNKNGLACWKSSTEYKPSSVTLIAQNEQFLTFPSDIKIDSTRHLWVLSNGLPKYLVEGHNQNKINIRIFRINLDAAVEGTQCE